MNSNRRVRIAGIGIALFLGVVLRFGAEFLLGRPMRRWELLPRQDSEIPARDHVTVTPRVRTRAEQSPAATDVVRADRAAAIGRGSAEPAALGVSVSSPAELDSALGGLAPSTRALRDMCRSLGVPEVFDRAFAEQQAHPIGFSMGEAMQLGEHLLERRELQEDFSHTLSRIAARNVDVLETRKLSGLMASVQVAAFSVDGHIETVYGMDQGAPNVSAELQAEAFVKLAGARWSELPSAKKRRVLELTADYQAEFEVAKRELWSFIAQRGVPERQPVADVACLVVRAGRVMIVRGGDDSDIDSLIKSIGDERQRFRVWMSECLR